MRKGVACLRWVVLTPTAAAAAYFWRNAIIG